MNRRSLLKGLFTGAVAGATVVAAKPDSDLQVFGFGQQMCAECLDALEYEVPIKNGRIIFIHHTNGRCRHGGKRFTRMISEMSVSVTPD